MYWTHGMNIQTCLGYNSNRYVLQNSWQFHCMKILDYTVFINALFYGWVMFFNKEMFISKVHIHYEVNYIPFQLQYHGQFALAVTTEMAQKAVWSSGVPSHHLQTRWSMSAASPVETEYRWTATHWDGQVPSTVSPVMYTAQHGNYSRTNTNFTFKQPHSSRDRW